MDGHAKWRVTWNASTIPLILKFPVWTRRWLKCVRLKLVLLNLNLLRIVVSSVRKRLHTLKTLKTTCLVSLLFLLLISEMFAKNYRLFYMKSPLLKYYISSLQTPEIKVKLAVIESESVSVLSLYPLLIFFVDFL